VSLANVIRHRLYTHYQVEDTARYKHKYTQCGKLLTLATALQSPFGLSSFTDCSRSLTQ